MNITQESRKAKLYERWCKIRVHEG